MPARFGGPASSKFFETINMSDKQTTFSVRAAVDSFRRGGHTFGRTPVVLDFSKLSDAQIDAIRNERMLVVAPYFDPADATDKAAAKKAAADKAAADEAAAKKAAADKAAADEVAAKKAAADKPKSGA